MNHPSIADLESQVQNLDDDMREVFNRLFQLWSIEGVCKCPSTIHDWAIRQFKSVAAVEKQTIIRIQNQWTWEGALFNPMRSLRPTSRTNEDILDKVKPRTERMSKCPFCDVENRTPTSAFSGEPLRFHGKFCCTASNAAKYDGRHGLIVFGQHNPLPVTQDQLLDYMKVANQWFTAARDVRQGFIYPFLMWNCRWRAGASVEHGHMQITMAKDKHYPRIERLCDVANRYFGETGSDYFDDFFKVHRALGLALWPDGNPARGNVRAIINLCPFRDKEIWLLGEALDEALAKATHWVLDRLCDRAKVHSFNLGILHPPLTREGKWSDFPVIVRIIDRLSVGELPSDISGMGIFAGADAIASDPFKLARLLRKR